jgi:Ni/Fe-hydrogenase subunit HybB-like protein
MNTRANILKTVLWAVMGVLAVVTVARFARGLGATTALSDATPWGFWIAFDVMSGVALAAGGFVLAATVYIFGRQKYRPFVRPAILTAFLGYLAVAVGLLYDLGLPWHIWHPAVYPQHHSVLFEVAMCVMLYLTVLGLEFLPVVLEHRWFDRPLFRRIHKLLHGAVIPLVITGIVLSTLHQSSLGSLFLITPYRLHPLWYSPIIYVLFFVSAVALGMMMVTLESLVSAFFYRHKVRMELLSGLGAATALVLALYIVLRVGDLFVRGVLPSALDGSWQSYLFVAELLVCAVIPAVLLSIRRVRTSIAGLAVCSIATVLGMVWNRLDVAIVAISRPAGTHYFPSWMEFLVSFGVIAAAALAFLFLVERLRVYEERARVAAKKPSYDPATLHGLTPPTLAAPRRYSLAFIAAAAIVTLFLPQRAVLGVRPTRTPVSTVRAVEGLVYAGAEHKVSRLDFDVDGVAAGARETRLLMIDGNRNGDLVLFDHEAHVARETGPDTCSVCHHLNMPLDRSTPCSECHRDMYETTDVFVHSSHVAKLGGDEGCVKCHSDASAVKTEETATACVSCHAEQVGHSTVVEAPGDRWRPAPGYMDGMHDLCVRCHQQKVQETPDQVAEHLDRCDTCHNVDYTSRLARLIPSVKEKSAAQGVSMNRPK